VNWYILCGNANFSEEFFEKHLDKVEWMYLSRNTNLSPEFFEKHADKVSWSALSWNNFSCYLDKEENRIKMSQVLTGIKDLYYIPSCICSCLPNGGCGYIEMLSKYKDF